MMRESMVFYKSFYDAIRQLPDESQLTVFRAIAEYGIMGEEPKCEGVAKAIFSLVKPQIDANNKRYENGKRNKKQEGRTTSVPKSRSGRNREENSGESETERDESKTEANPDQNLREQDVTDKRSASGAEANVNANVNANANDNVNVNSNVSVHENGSTYAQSESTAPSAPPEILLPLNDKTEYPVTKEQTAQWAELYPSVNILQELRKMRGWLLANPNRRKTRNGILRFITSWLAREQDRSKTPQKPKIPSSPYDFAALEKAALNKMMNGPRG